MVKLAIGSLICLIVAVACVVVAAMITLLARVAASQGGATGCFTLAAALLIVLAISLLCIGF